MSVRLEEEVIRLEGECRLEEAEALLQLVLQSPGRGVDLSAARHIHAAVLQVLLSFGVPLAAEPDDAFLRDHVVPSLRRTFAVAGRP